MEPCKPPLGNHRSSQDLLIPIPQLIEMGLSRGEQLGVLDVPDVGIGPSGHVGNKLSEAPVWVPVAKLHQGMQEDRPLAIIHGSTLDEFSIRPPRRLRNPTISTQAILHENSTPDRSEAIYQSPRRLHHTLTRGVLLPSASGIRPPRDAISGYPDLDANGQRERDWDENQFRQLLGEHLKIVTACRRSASTLRIQSEYSLLGKSSPSQAIEEKRPGGGG